VSGPRRRRFLLAALPVALAAGVVALVLALADEDEPGGADGGGADLPVGEPVQPSGEPDSEPEPEGSAAPGSADERDVARAVRRYIDAIDARDGAAVCASLAPGAIEGFELPRDGGRCADAVR